MLNTNMLRIVYVAHFLTLIKYGLILQLQSIRFSWFRKGY